MSIQANPDATIGTWSASKLIRFIKQMFETDPPIFQSRANIQDLTVTSLLNVKDQIKFIRDPNFHVVGGTGEPPFTNSWVNFGSGTGFAGFWKDPFGIVHLQGAIKSGTLTASAFTLPVGSRPGFQCNFPTISNSALGYVHVESNGQVVPQSGSSVWFSLDGLSFKAA